MTHAADAAYPPVERAERTAGPGVPDRRLFWQWVWSAVRPVVGWVLALAGGIALLVGWYGVSGDSLPAKQLPYLVSGGLTGIALIVLAGVFLATDDIRRQLGRLETVERQVAELHALFAVELSSPGAVLERPSADTLVALPGGASYHRPDCALVAGKEQAQVVAAADIDARSLRPCRVCQPPSSTA